MALGEVMKSPDCPLATDLNEMGPPCVSGSGGDSWPIQRLINVTGWTFPDPRQSSFVYFTDLELHNGGCTTTVNLDGSTGFLSLAGDRSDVLNGGLEPLIMTRTFSGFNGTLDNLPFGFYFDYWVSGMQSFNISLDFVNDSDELLLSRSFMPARLPVKCDCNQASLDASAFDCYDFGNNIGFPSQNWLPYFSQGFVPANTTSINLTISATLTRGQVIFATLDNLMLEVSCDPTKPVEAPFF